MNLRKISTAVTAACLGLAACGTALAASDVSQKGGHLKFKSDDGNFAAQIGGRIMADYAFISDDRNVDGNGSEFRRARLFFKGKLYKAWAFKAQYEFAGDAVEIKDLYLRYTGWKPVTLTIGNHKMPFGLEELTSSKYITFMERSAPNDVFAVGRQNGVTLATHGQRWTLAGAVHMQGIDNNNAGGDESLGYGARFTLAPMADKGRVLHLGAAYHNWQYADDFSGSYADARNRARPEIHMINTRPYDTTIASAKNASTLGLEAAAVFGPLSLQGEYFTKTLSSDVAGASDVDLTGYYVYASYFLTGESRNYKAKKGAFGRVKPASVVGKGGSGAWELGVRYSSIDLYDGTTSSNPGISAQGEEGSIVTVGLNWYATSNIRFMANYVNATVKYPGTANSDDKISSVQFRGQIDF